MARRVLVILILTLLGLWACPAQAVSVSVRYEPYTGELVNPYIGNVAWAEDDYEHEQPFTLVYANLTWAELEPTEGVFAFDEFEQRCHFDKWRSEGKRLILRFVMDMPESKRHADIPEWLRESTQGAYYHVEYGRGYCPDYTNETLIAAHARAIAALGQRYDDDPFVAYVQLGSLGHWGEWHVHEDAGIMPVKSVRDIYAAAYTDAFQATPLMMRRPFSFAAQNNLGLYNDTAGQEKPTIEWLSWIMQGGAYEEEPAALIAMPNGWKIAPIGGELSTRMDDADFLEDGLETTIRLFERSHTSWIGPGSFVDVERGGEYQAAIDQVMRRIGYRLRVERAQIDLSASGSQLTLVWQNDGIAPFYHGWQACLRLTDESGAQEVVPLEMRIGDVLPRAPLTVTCALPSYACRVEVGIVEPGQAEPGVALAMQAPRDGCWYELYEKVER